MEKVIRDAGGAGNFIATITYPNTKTQIPSHYHYEYVLKGEKVVDDFDNINPDEVNKKQTQSNTSSTSKASDNTKSNNTGNTNKTTDTSKSTTSKTTTSNSSTKSETTSTTKHNLSDVDTNGNGKVTIAEAQAAGYKMPIHKDHWLYQYMDDKDGDGMVGE